MTDIELNSILFYADYLSLKAISLPVTDNCKYFFVYECPVNAAYVLNLEPVYNPDNEYFLEAYRQYMLIKKDYSDDGVASFIGDICFIRACGMVDAERMLKLIHMFSTKEERKQAFREYREWKKNRIYTHQVLDENGNPQQTTCTMYFSHAETGTPRRSLFKSFGDDGEAPKE